MSLTFAQLLAILQAMHDAFPTVVVAPVGSVHA
jgi:hypothetical protein